MAEVLLSGSHFKISFGIESGPGDLHVQKMSFVSCSGVLKYWEERRMVGSLF